jgi:hypothetical protein
MRKIAAMLAGVIIVLASSSLLWDIYFHFTGDFMQWVIVASGLLFLGIGARLLWAGITPEGGKQ